MANKKLLICAAFATGLLLTACVKKEEPKNEEQQEQAATESQTQPEPAKIQEFESLESVDKHEAPAPVVETTREQTPNTTTEVRRETRPAQTENPTATETPRTEEPKPTKTEQPKTEQTVKAEQKPAKTEQVKAPKSSAPAQSEDDAVAAAIAAATPALNN
ncbi:internalin [Acinetobacter colistiniresistens]|uniref:internalin n=1 Tax=Acinetobacter colistiniresistens TaxID=280145 RepID=UPI00211C2652|nr:internalin [Acinetobacter colistiniresistens]UUM26674.1 internalin [Acinetobacter colistiniresistens]